MTNTRGARLFTLAFLALTAAGCDDGTAPSDGFAGLDPDGVRATVDAAYETIAASADGNFVLSEFMFTAVGDDVDLAPELRGRTFVWSPDEEAWTADPDRDGAPADGLRVVWYATDDLGNVVVPLDQIGIIELTDEDTATRDRFGVVIVRTDSGADTLADYTYAFALEESGGTRTEHNEMNGYFADGADRVDVDIALQETTDVASGDRAYTADVLFDGTAGSYHWRLDGSSDGATGSYADDLVTTVVREQRPTVLTLDRTGQGNTEDGTGTLSHDGTTIAQLAIDDGAYSFTRPEGGAFSGQQAADLEALVVTMLLRAPLLLLNLPFLDL